jgi:hypothetical protein
MDEDELTIPEIDPHKVLLSIASPTDLMVHPLSSDLGELYRSSSVAMLFRSKVAMERVLSTVVDHIKTNAKLQRSSLSNIEVVNITDPGHILGDGDLFILP